MGLLAGLRRWARLVLGPQGKARLARAGGLLLLRTPGGCFLTPAEEAHVVSVAGEGPRRSCWATAPPGRAAPPAARCLVWPCCGGGAEDGRGCSASGEAAELHKSGVGRWRPPEQHGLWSEEAPLELVAVGPPVQGSAWGLGSGDLQACPGPPVIGPCRDGLEAVFAGRIGLGGTLEVFFWRIVGPL
ncbi:hypothetical protein NDU88_002288 [Pleurodeles waltl]|uniref:Uncharacterized protein n=1 Tax=Pleurodeles waltl TaxID=8319 RepID=A0AAV7LDR2_PLEWA|nr:hypothetical protein NDU88_002288 [Pleurodeles waltl]